MASPQIENGYIKLSNELMDALCRQNLPGSERQIFDAILRKTYGFGKKSDYISHSQLAKMTGIDRKNISRILKSLKKKKLVVINDDSYVHKLSINKDYDQWKTDVTIYDKFKTAVTIDGTLQTAINPAQTAITNDGKTAITNDGNKRKKIYTKETVQIFKLFISTLTEDSEKKFVPSGENQKKEWLETIDKCIRIDGYQPWQIADMILKFRSDDFWNTNFYTPMKLRRKNKEGVKYIDYFWNRIKDDLEPPDDETQYIDSILSEQEF